MIKVEIKKDAAVPLIYCDACGERIEKASEGIVVYKQETGIPKFYHKSFVKGGCYFDRRSPWIPLSGFVYCLMHNLKIDYGLAKKSTALFREAFRGLEE